ncbi:MAG: hypothetical protein LBR07_09490, partial [Puniceicoccales bacterium]|nr:hypothetical protein [Puniceicoccales bacterium]
MTRPVSTPISSPKTPENTARAPRSPHAGVRAGDRVRAGSRASRRWLAAAALALAPALPAVLQPVPPQPDLLPPETFSSAAFLAPRAAAAVATFHPSTVGGISNWDALGNWGWDSAITAVPGLTSGYTTDVKAFFDFQDDAFGASLYGKTIALQTNMLVLDELEIRGAPVLDQTARLYFTRSGAGTADADRVLTNNHVFDGGFTAAGTAALTLAGNGTLASNSTVRVTDGGTLNLGRADQSGAETLAGSGTLTFTGDGSAGNAVNLYYADSGVAASLTLVAGAGVTVNVERDAAPGVSVGYRNAFQVTADGVLNLNSAGGRYEGAITNAGTINVNELTLYQGTANITGGGLINIAGGKTFTFAPLGTPTDYTFDNRLAGGGVIEITLRNATNTLAFTNTTAGAFTGTAELNRGTLNWDLGAARTLRGATLLLNNSAAPENAILRRRPGLPQRPNRRNGHHPRHRRHLRARRLVLPRQGQRPLRRQRPHQTLVNRAEHLHRQHRNRRRRARGQRNHLR